MGGKIRKGDINNDVVYESHAYKIQCTAHPYYMVNTCMLGLHLGGGGEGGGC